MVSASRSSRLFRLTGLYLFVLLLSCVPARAVDVTSTLVIGGAKIDVAIAPGQMKLSQADLIQWGQSAPEAVATYYGGYPVPPVLICIIPTDGAGVRHGQTFGYEGGLIKIRVGGETQPSELANDWMLTPEMIHFFFPWWAQDHPGSKGGRPVH